MKYISRKGIGLFLFCLVVATSVGIIWQFVSFMMDVQEVLDWLGGIEIR